MVKRLVDGACALVALVVLSPVIAVAALGILVASPGPILYHARRVGRFGLPFAMYKLRTMHVPSHAGGSRITANADARVFAWGRWLRRAKIDELPQLFNVLRGEMAVIGPRPEDPHFLSHYRTAAQFETLRVRPGLASPGSLYHDSHGERLLRGTDPDVSYTEVLLPVKLALDVVYVRRASFAYDLRLVGRTLWQVLGHVLGRRHFADPPELALVREVTVPEAGHERRNPYRLRVRRWRAVLLLLTTGAGAAACGRETPLPLTLAPLPTWLHDSSETILVGAGDMGFCDDPAGARTAALLDAIPGTVLTVGDHAYPDGTADEFVRCYTPTWGRHVARTRPVPGNHDYMNGAAEAYFAYFGTRAGQARQGYYSYPLGSWHVIALNSEIAMDRQSAQLEWLRADLQANPSRCLLAYWHRPLFSSVGRRESRVSTDAWALLLAAGAEVVLNGHDHHYERFAPQGADGVADPVRGIRQFVIGTGGPSDHPFRWPRRNSEVRRAHAPGVLALRLTETAFEWRFVGLAGSTFSDAGSGECRAVPMRDAPVAET